MPLTPGRSGVSKSRCIPVDNRIESLIQFIDQFGVGVADSPDDPVWTPVFNDGGDLVDSGGVIVPGAGAFSFQTIVVSGQSDVVADSATDTLTLVAGANIVITTNAGTDTITIAASSGASGWTGELFYAYVNNANGYSGGDSSISFDGAVALGSSTIPMGGTGSAANIGGRSFVNDEMILVISDDSTGYVAIKLTTNVILANPVYSGDTVTVSDTEGTLTGASAITGEIYGGTDKVFVQSTPKLQAESPEGSTAVIPFMQRDSDAKWVPLFIPQVAIFKVTTEISARSDDGTDYTWGEGEGRRLKISSGGASVTGAEAAVNIYNTTTNVIEVDHIIHCKLVDGRWTIDVDDCNTTE